MNHSLSQKPYTPRLLLQCTYDEICLYIPQIIHTIWMQESTNNLLVSKSVHLLAFHNVVIYLLTLTATPPLHFSAFLCLLFLLTSFSLVTMLTRKPFKSTLRQTCHLTSYNGNEDPSRFFGRSFLMPIQQIKVLKKVIKIPWSENLPLLLRALCLMGQYASAEH